ncbi:MAG TPA: hypothetical protein VIS06_12210 [Mycobacteriales bacterium]
MSTFATAPVMVWELAGRPVRESLNPEAVPGVCAMCGRTVDVSMPTAKAIGGNFTDQYLLARPDSTRVCYACVWVCSGKPPDTVRMWTVAASEAAEFGPSHPKAPGWGNSHLLLTARNDMRQVVDLLADPPDADWVVSVAESGQKHHLPYARINHGTGQWTVRMDAVDVTATPGQFRTVLGHVLRLRAVKFSAGAIETLDPGNGLTAATLPVWRAHAEPLAPWRGSPLLHLTCFVIKKEHMDEYIGRYGAGDLDGRGGSGDPVLQPVAGQHGLGHGVSAGLAGPGGVSDDDSRGGGDTLF